MLFARYHRGWRDFNDFYDPGFILRHVLEDLRRGERIAESPKGKVTAFLSPGALGMFLYPVLLGVNGRNVAKGDSPLKGRLGEELLDPCLTIIDDPHTDYHSGATVIDDDGVPTRTGRLEACPARCSISCSSGTSAPSMVTMRSRRPRSSTVSLTKWKKPTASSG